jgi:NitT/TauT family transport system substrate-binding protein
VLAIPIHDCAPFFAALQQGFFTAGGLDVVTEAESGGTVGIPAVVSGSYDIVYTNIPSALLAIQQGIDLRFIAGGSQLNPPDSTGLLVRRDEGLHSGKDFEGKSIGINDTRSLQWMYARGWVKATGGDPEKVTYRQVPFPQMADALKTKRVDGIIPSEPFLSLSRSDPALELIAAPGRTVFPKGRVAGWVVTGDFTVRHPELVRAFAIGMDKGAQWVNANLNTQVYNQFIAGYTKLDAARVAALAKGPTSTRIDGNDVRRMADLMRANGVLTGGFDPATKVFVPR